VSFAERLLASGNIRDRFERLISVEEAGAWKPAARAYEYAASVTDTKPADMLMVAVHPWDVDGARRAGYQTVWVNRTGSRFPATFLEPTYTVASIEELGELWA
jgi:2-haloacid dehalogenase